MTTRPWSLLCGEAIWNSTCNWRVPEGSTTEKW